MRRSIGALVLWLCCSAAWPPVWADDAAPLAADPALEARVNQLAEVLRCLVCQNQTIADSHAGLALDLKAQIREQLRAGRSRDEVLDYMVARYGDFVLYRPPVKASTALLWFGPFALLAVGAVTAWVVVCRRRPQPGDTALSDPLHAQAAAWLAQQPERPS
jgi:cytochrome c-type biogenesis protein CcmH